MSMAGKLIVVSYRLPFRFSVVDSKVKFSRSAGGLVTSLSSLFQAGSQLSRRYDSCHWVGVSDLSLRAFNKANIEDALQKDHITMHPVFLNSATKENFYDGFSNSVLWPLFMYFPSFVSYKEEFFLDYCRASELVVRKITALYEEGDVVWVHDYHWMLVPALLREKLPRAKVGFFLHIPFPSHELYRHLPKHWRLALINGILGADLVGFQTEDYLRHFNESVGIELPASLIQPGSFTADQRSVAAKKFSISIDYERFHTASKSPDIRKDVKRIQNRIASGKLILSVDRLDYTKAIYNRLESFQLFLESNPALREKVTYLLIMVPTRETILKYKENKANIEALISRINGQYGTLGWTPVLYQYRTVEFKRLVALYAASDVAFVAPSRDGMNLVAKEYVASRPHSDGVLILSETAGAAHELKGAIMVNPNDRIEMADSILKALQMTQSEQKARMEKMQNHLRRNDVFAWAIKFLDSVDQINEQVEIEA